jgi:seryl-tRNA synthetase
MDDLNFKPQAEEPTVATVVQDQTPSSPHLIDSYPGADLWALFGVGGLGLWQVGRLVVRRFFKDSTEITKDRAETNIVVLLQEDNASLHKKNDALQERIEVISKERNEAVSQMGRFLAETELYRQKISELQQSITIMTSKLEEQSDLLRSVLIENARLKLQVDHLEQSNLIQGKEIENLRQAVGGMKTSPNT